MTTGPAPPLTALVVGPDPWRRQVADELTTLTGDVLQVVSASGPTDAVAALPADPDVGVSLVVVVAGDDPVDDVLDRLEDLHAPAADAATLLVTDRPVHDDVSRSLDGGRLAGVLAAPWTPSTLAGQARSQLARWLRRQRRGSTDAETATLALLDRDERRSDQPASELLRDFELDETAVAAQLLGAIDRALGPRPTLRLAAGTRLTRQDHEVNAVFMIRSGTVALDRTTPLGEVRLHHTSTGPIVGLLSLAQQKQAFFTARATTEIEVVHLTLDQLDLALQLEPDVAAAMAAMSVRTLAQRLRRSEQLQVEKIQLNHDLEAERRRLADTLSALEAARLELVEQARMATLGELSAGVAHELSNPVTALARSASFVAEDLDRLLADHPEGEMARRVLAERRAAPPISTGDARAARRVVADALGGDTELARRLVEAGVTDPDRARDLATGPPATLEVVERVAALGAAVRSLEVAAGRITELVTSLRAYARPDTEPVDGIDLREVADDALRLAAHRLEGLAVERYYDPVPAIRGHPGQLGQLVINLVVNAAEALRGGGRVVVATDQPDPEHVRIAVVDDGPGIDRDILPRLFEPRFTTKHGRVRYGLGLGLPIARRIADAHGGTLEIESEPGRTVVRATLPVAGPPPDWEEAVR